MENLDSEETARLLIDSGMGKVMPYGVAYNNDNGMKLESLYRGRDRHVCAMLSAGAGSVSAS